MDSYQLNRKSVQIKSSEQVTPPQWAIQQQLLFQTLNQAAQEFIERYTHADGTLIWRSEWPGMDGSDDPYEGFMNLALLYVLGGSAELHEQSRKIWEGITWQWTEYGQIHREFDRYYDWMHHGEGYLYLYFLGLAGPATPKDRQRAVRFANMYSGDDPQAPNYDSEKKLIRSPLTGSMGPRFQVTEEDWSTHRGILDDYLAPFEDIPGVDFASRKCPWSDDETYKQIIQRMNERMNRGDVPLNLNVTSLLAHAFLHTGDERFRDVITEYLSAWEERTQTNGGIIPDNIGLSGEIGQYNDGKWWGGYYGWRWPHGFLTIIEPLTNACMNAVLLTGDMKKLQLAREQLDRNWELRQLQEDKWVVPHKHFDSGWADYREATPHYPVYLWFISMEDEDLERVERIPKNHDWNEVIVPKMSGTDKKTGRNTKHYIGNTQPWYQYIRGCNSDYPERILSANYELIGNQLAKMRSAEGDPHNWAHQYSEGDFSSIHAWQEMCPLYFEGLVQLTLGAPMHNSHGGLQHGRVRYFDALAKRPGLPSGISALVEKLTSNSVTLHLVNTSLFDDQEMIVQAGMFGEHRFLQVELMNQKGEVTDSITVGDRYLQVSLPAGTGITLQASMERYVNTPTYDMPWPEDHKSMLIQGRVK
ncbi:hypothetical protein [Paenibacillus macquariensis]|uniref:Linalool dehydratase/isomerase domain-containing protein n=1 Tax=Paenibacillus macquariensis TaxID=948756 RepID=A0ABY1KC77_9BACL|nr:hypothetical protein [Paenibacillus macquariensis]MEC0089619.1 hypothetical protein [Paenibacillus macquariensis]OAB30890.1 hypothetical protein PMSM_22445 [Paenibacillus macquariensis subsp. macquariensis]SIR58456.1 hypothetical protein SAMN05421578_12055 [Paenibacillus macquariensis]